MISVSETSATFRDHAVQSSACDGSGYAGAECRSEGRYGDIALAE
jgi:hypothetical protein